MTRPAPGLESLRQSILARVSVRAIGIVGDVNHQGGYHLGIAEVPWNDPSVQSRRDKAGASLGGDWATAIDIDMGWPRSRKWLAWLVHQVQADKFNDIAGIIGSIDGRTEWYWHWSTGFTADPYGEHWDHIRHVHIEFFRDSVFRDQSAVFVKWWHSQIATTPARPSQSHSQRPTRKPTPTHTPSPAGVSMGSTGGVFPWHPTIVGAGVAAWGLAWIIQRRGISRETAT